jgi:predicted DNA-binding transcriptional regulator YafY
MARNSTRSRLDRLERLQGLLRDGDLTSTGELAAALGVSSRSLARDLALLRESGVPIESDRGRGGGVRLPARWSIGHLHLSEEDAIDMLLSIAVAEKMDSPLLLSRIAGVRQKLTAAFAGNQQQRIRSLRKRVLVGSPASSRVLASYRRPGSATLSNVKAAFFNLRVLRIVYVDQEGRETTREVEPQFLYLNPPVWYLLGWDRLRDGVRFFRVDRLREVAATGQAFRLRNSAEFLSAAEQAARPL